MFLWQRLLFLSVFLALHPEGILHAFLLSALFQILLQRVLPSAVLARSHNVPHTSPPPSAEHPSPLLFVYCRLMTASGHNRRLLKTECHRLPCLLTACQRSQWQLSRCPHSSRPHLSWTAHRRVLPLRIFPLPAPVQPFFSVLCHAL